MRMDEERRAIDAARSNQCLTGRDALNPGMRDAYNNERIRQQQQRDLERVQRELFRELQKPWNLESSPSKTPTSHKPAAEKTSLGDLLLGSGVIFATFIGLGSLNGGKSPAPTFRPEGTTSIPAQPHHGPDHETAHGNQTIYIDPPAPWSWDAGRDAPVAYDGHVFGFLQETGHELKMDWKEAEQHGDSIISTLLSKPLETPRYAFASKTSTGETIAIASAPVGIDGSISSLGCVSADGQIVNFGKTTTAYTSEGKLTYEFTRQVLVTISGKELDISQQAFHMGDCRRAFALLKQNYNLPELGSPRIN